MSFASWSRMTASLLGAAALSCAHYQNEGAYAFTADEIILDECGALPTPESLWDGRLIIDGQLVRLVSELFAIELRGKFRENSQSWYLDGSAENVAGTARGQACQFDLVSVHLEAATRPADFDVFTGRIRVEFQARNSDVCSCEVSATYTAQRTGP